MAGRLSKKRMQAVCDELAKGKSLRSICDNNKEMPAWSTVLQTVQRDEDSFEMYARARAIGAEVLADHMHDLASSPLPEGLDPRHANAEVQRRRLEVDTLKWTFARMQPRGVRHKKEDVDTNQQGAGQITLVWGDEEQTKFVETDKDKKQQTNKQTDKTTGTDNTGAEILKLVTDKSVEEQTDKL